MKFKLLLIFFINLSFAQQPVLDWAKSFGGTSQDRCHTIAVDPSNNVLVGGGFAGSVDFDPNNGTFALTTPLSYDYDAFISKLDSNGNLVWAKKVGSSPGSDEIYSITVDHQGNIYALGNFRGTVDFDPNAGVYNLTEMGFGSGDMFLLKLNAAGDFVYAKQFGGNGVELGRSIALDSAGNIYFTGEVNSAMSGSTILTTDFDPGPGVTPVSSITGLNGDVFVCKLDSNGNLLWVKTMGGNGPDDAKSIAVDVNGNVYTTGIFRATADFDPSSAVFNLVNPNVNRWDVFVSKLDTNGNFVWAKSFGNPTQDDYAFGIKVDLLGNVYSTGNFNGNVDFDPGTSVANLNSLYDTTYISKLDVNGNYVWAKCFGGSSSGRAIALDASSNIYLTGYFNGTVDFDPNAGVAHVSGLGGPLYTYICKLDANGMYQWAKGFGNSNNPNHTMSYAITTDATNHVYTTGNFYAIVDFDPCESVMNLTSNGQEDVFVQKLNQDTVGGPQFNPISPICYGSTSPILPTTSLNGVVGTWNPSVVDNTTSGTYIFTPNAGQCVTQTTSLSVTVLPIVTTVFPSFSSVCSGTTPPVLPTTSSNGIVGTWSPSVIDNTTSGTYVFTPNAGQCGTIYTLNITVDPSIVPQFNSIAPICAGDGLAALPTTSLNGILGTWSPTLNNQQTTTYTFTPNPGICATTQTLTITVNAVTPLFHLVSPICAGETLQPLPTTSINGIPGSWSPGLNNLVTTTYTFTPNSGYCAPLVTMTIVVNQPAVPNFNSINPVCQGTTIASLPTTSLNGIIGTWSPALNNQATTLYTFTPNPGQCAAIQTLTIVVTNSITPQFQSVNPVCAGSSINSLPTTSINGISGTWSPALNNQQTTTYTFTPNAGQCATSQSLTIQIIQPTVPVFNQVNPICIGDALTPLPQTSSNGITGTWSPTLNNQQTTIYTFTPNSGECATQQTMTIQVNSIVPQFVTIAPVCIDEVIPALPTISLNGITGVWYPALNNQQTTTYTFIPDVGQCASSQSLTIEVKPFVQLQVQINQQSDFNLNQDLEVLVNPPGNYLFTLDDTLMQQSNVFKNLSSCIHKLKIQDLNGCSKSDLEMDLFVLGYPPYFTPNGDGYNEYWNINCNDIVNAKITIFDRYGKLIKQFESSELGWDGTFNGKDLPSTDYWFTIEYESNGQKKQFKNHFTLKR